MDKSLNIEKLEINGNELTYRTGEAPRLDQVRGIGISGDLLTPKRFYEAYKDRWKARDMYVEVSHINGEVSLFIDQHSTLESSYILGAVKPHWIIGIFRINDMENDFNKETFVRLLKSYRHFFDRDKNMALVTILEQLDLQITKNVKDHDNRRGTYHQEIKQVCDSQLPESINMTFPAIIGGDEATFEMEIHFEIKGDKPRFYFHSPQLIEYTESQKEKLLKEAVKIFESIDSIPIIYT